MVKAVRGATTITENTEEEIFQAAQEMIKEIMDKNDIYQSDMISIIFTVTDDITAAFPAAGIRKMGITDVPLIDMASPKIDNALKMCIRVMVLVNTDRNTVNHIYQRGAKVLRPDIAGNEYISVAIDGPAGAGKSSVAKKTADDLGYIYIDTGAMYRAAALYMIEKGIDIETDIKAVEKAMENVDINIEHNKDGQRIMLNGRDVTAFIRTPEISAGASGVAKIQAVREKLVKMQRKMAKKSNVIMDGRDICTCVLPNAAVKIFMTASVEERAKRRYAELKEKGEECTLEEIVRDIEARDKQDSERKISPLRKSEDAYLFDTSKLNFEESVKELKRIISDNTGV